jgi:hypothetical protein
MWQDPIIKEVRAIRDSYAKKFKYDLDAIYHDLKELETKSGREVVLFPSKPIIPYEKKDLARKAENGLTKRSSGRAKHLRR